MNRKKYQSRDGVLTFFLGSKIETGFDTKLTTSVYHELVDRIWNSVAADLDGIKGELEDVLSGKAYD